jgi:hypothetical protein
VEGKKRGRRRLAESALRFFRKHNSCASESFVIVDCFISTSASFDVVMLRFMYRTFNIFLYYFFHQFRADLVDGPRSLAARLPAEPLPILFGDIRNAADIALF